MDNDTAPKTVISWTREKLALLKKRLKEAEQQGLDMCSIDGHTIYVPYGNYLADYLDSQFSQ